MTKGLNALARYCAAERPRGSPLAIGAALLFLMNVVGSMSAQSVSVTPDGATTTVAQLSTQSYVFTVQNTGGTSTMYTLKTGCLLPLSSCKANPSSVILNGGASATVTVTYRSAPGGSTGTLSLVATKTAASTPTDTGTVSVTSTSPPSSGYLSVDTTIYNYSNHRPEWCEAGCFTASYGVSTVPYVSGDAPRNVSVIYNGDAVATRPIVSVDASLGAGAPTLQEFWLELRDSTGTAITLVNGDTKLRFNPPSPQTTKVRLSAGFNASAYSTGVYPITAVVTAKYASSSDVSMIPTRFLVINGRKDFGVNSTSINQGAVARGWYVGSFSRLYEQGGDLLIVDGGRSARFYTGCGTDCYAAPAGDFSRIERVSPSGKLTRFFPDSSQERFDGGGWLDRRLTRTQDSVLFKLGSNLALSQISDPVRRVSGQLTWTNFTSGLPTGFGRIIYINQSNGINGGNSYYAVSSTDSSLTEWRDPDWTVPGSAPTTNFVYDASGRLSKVINRKGDTTTFTYDAVTWKLATVVSPRFTADPRLYGAGQTRQLTTTYRPWQTASVPTTSTGSTMWTPALADTIRGAVTDAGGHVTAFTVNRWGQAIVTTELPGSGLARTTTVYKPAYSPLPDSVRHHEGGVDEFQYSGPLVTYQKLAGTNAVNIAYTKFAQPDSIWGTGTPKQVFYLGSRGRVDSSAVIAGADVYKTKYKYDSRFRDSTVTDPAGHVTRYFYNPTHGNVDSVTVPGSRKSERRFDYFGRDTASRVAPLAWRKTVYDTLSRVVTALTAAASNPDTTIFTYDALYQTQVRDADSNTYNFSYNALGLVTQRTDPAGNADKYFYNDEGLPTTWVNRRGDTLKTTYDDLHRRLTKSGQVAVVDSFSYAASGRVVSAWNKNASVSMFADESGWVDSVVTRLATDTTKRFRVLYTKTAVCQLDSVDIASNTPISFTRRKYVWNATKGVLDSIRLGGESTVIGRNTELLRSTIAFPVGVTRTESTLSIHNQFQSAYSVTGVDTLLWRTSGFDAAGRVNQYVSFANSSKDRAKYAYTYDDQGRVKKWIDSVLFYANLCSFGTDPDTGGVVCPGYTPGLVLADTLTYDRVGNITYSFGSPGTGSATYSKNRITSWPGYTFGWDSAGNVTSRTPTGGPTTYFHWSADGLLDSVIVGTRKLQYDYDALGQLVRKRVNGTPVAHFLWDQGHLLAELNGTDTLRVAEYAYYPGVDQPLAIITGATSIAKTSYLQQDPLGNVIGAVTSGPAVDGARFGYDPWGFHDAPFLVGVATTDTNRLRFQGLVYEGDTTQLYYVRNRWYDPRTHRFMTQDPIGLKGGINPYAFAGNDPINYRDPFGLEECMVVGGREWSEVIGLRVIIHAEPYRLICTSSGGGIGYGGPGGGAGGGSGGQGPGDNPRPKAYSCPALPADLEAQRPGRVSFARNMTTARGLRSLPRFMGFNSAVGPTIVPLRYIAFYGLVRTGGDWDIKGNNPTRQDVGNAHYGAVGLAAGFTEFELLWAAGAYQYFTSSPTEGTPISGAPWGDPQRDRDAIFRGFAFARSCNLN